MRAQPQVKSAGILLLEISCQSLPCSCRQPPDILPACHRVMMVNGGSWPTTAVEDCPTTIKQRPAKLCGSVQRPSLFLWGYSRFVMKPTTPMHRNLREPLQNTSLCRRLSARFSIGTQLDGGFPSRPKNGRSRSRNADKGLATSSTEKRTSQSSTRSSPGRTTPSNSSPSNATKKSSPVVRKSFSNDQYNRRGPNLPTIPGSEGSDAAASSYRKPVSTMNGKKDSPPKRSGTPSNSSGTSSISRSGSRGYSTHRSPQPQSLNAAVHKFTTPVDTTPPADAFGVKISPSKFTCQAVFRYSTKPFQLLNIALRYQLTENQLLLLLRRRDAQYPIHPSKPRTAGKELVDRS